VAIDTPAALAERAETEQRIQFRPSVPFEDSLLTSLPSVTSLSRRGDVVVVAGGSDALLEVITTLSAHEIKPRQLRVDQGNLEDAFLELTGRHTEAEVAGR
jgi:ABC-2 type transport system ATP-binding protein